MVKHRRLTPPAFGIGLLTAVTMAGPASGKVKPSSFRDLVKRSELIALVQVTSATHGGKSKPGFATARVQEVVSGKASGQTLKLQWTGYGITGLGPWLLFLKRSTKPGVYEPAYGARSLWFVHQAKIGGKCCSRFTILRYPIQHLTFPKALLETRPVYLNELPRPKNPVRVRGLRISKVRRYISSQKR